MMDKNQMEVRILEDGTVRIETGDMAGAAHKNADDFLAMVARLMGGEVDEGKVAHGHHHHHHHDHEHNPNTEAQS